MPSERSAKSAPKGTTVKRSVSPVHGGSLVKSPSEKSSTTWASAAGARRARRRARRSRPNMGEAADGERGDSIAPEPVTVHRDPETVAGRVRRVYLDSPDCTTAPMNRAMARSDPSEDLGALERTPTVRDAPPRAGPPARRRAARG